MPGGCSCGTGSKFGDRLEISSDASRRGGTIDISHGDVRQELFMQYQSRSTRWHSGRSIANRILLSGLALCSCNLHAKTLCVHCGSISKTRPTSITAALKLLDPSVPNKL